MTFKGNIKVSDFEFGTSTELIYSFSIVELSRVSVVSDFIASNDEDYLVILSSYKHKKYKLKEEREEDDHRKEGVAQISSTIGEKEKTLTRITISANSIVPLKYTMQAFTFGCHH